MDNTKKIKKTNTEVKTDDSKTVEKPSVKKGTVFNCEQLNVRSKSNTNCDILGVVNVGDELTIIDDLGEWYKVKYKGKDAFVMSAFVKA